MTDTDNRERRRFKRKIDRAIDRHADDIGPREAEHILQQRSQDMRELQEPDVTPSDMSRWSA